MAPQTRRTLEQALAQVRHHHLIFDRWGLGDRHTSGRGLAFNFAGQPGTGKTICAEAIAHELGLKLLVVNYAEAESMWFGETPKNIVAIFRAAAEQNAVLLFDEADAIAMRRSSGAGLPHERESNLTVNVLLRELEAFNGIVIFATNLAANFDPAFERRIRAHVLFEIPGPEERARIWELHIHPKKTPLASDVDFRRLAERYTVSGGDIKNAVLKAATLAAAEPGPDLGKRIKAAGFRTRCRRGARGKGSNATVTLRRYPYRSNPCHQCAHGGTLAAKRNFHGVGFSRHRFDRLVRGACIGAHALKKKSRKSKQAIFLCASFLTS